MASTAARIEAFTALGTSIEVIARPRLRDALPLARQVMADIDLGCSRFRPDSDLARVNAHPGRWISVGSLLIAALRVALEAAHETDGLVTPCLGRTLRSLGYDTDFDVVRERDLADSQRPQLAPRRDAWRDVEIDPDGAIRIPDDIELDLGATGKAFAADLAALTIRDRLGVDVSVSAGGDVRIVSDGGDPWPIEISERPEEPVAEVVSMIDGGIATSSITRRRWTHRGVVRHHLLDPRTGLPCTGPWRTVTASGPTCAAANVAATVAIVLGDDAPHWLNERAVWARLVGQDGQVVIVDADRETTS